MIGTVDAEKNRPIFEMAFKQVMSEVSMDDPVSDAFMEELFTAFLHGDDREGRTVAEKYLLPERWRWVGQNQQPDYREAIRQFVFRVNMTTYAMRRMDRCMNQVERAPYWQFICAGRGNCSRKSSDLMVYRYDDQFWQHFDLPCDEKECGCRIRNLGERDLIRYGLDVSSSNIDISTK
jgi:hypothetical protein